MTTRNDVVTNPTRSHNPRRTVGTVLRNEIGPQEVLLVIAVVLLAVGFWSWWRPGSFIAPGLVLLWIALPTRRPVIVREDPTPSTTTRRARANPTWTPPSLPPPVSPAINVPID